jgi:predicted secreted hydrolase
MMLGRAWAVFVLCGLAACGHRSAETAPERVPVDLLRGNAGAAFEPVIAPRSFEFPDDHGSHADYRTEWWYFTGNLEGSAGRHFGFELTFFRFALAPDPVPRTSAWGTTQSWMAHLAVTDSAGERFIAEERFAREALGLAGAQAEPFNVWVRNWSARSEGDLESAPITLVADGERIALELELRALKPVVLHGEGGMDRKGPDPGEASYYYSLPRLEAAGTLAIDGAAERVSGLAWLDREWSSGALDEALAGWDWFALQLDDGSDVMFYRLRRLDGSASRDSGGSMIAADGSRSHLALTDVQLAELDRWSSPASGARYPVRWLLEVPAADLALDVQAYIEGQELDLTVRYWEGAVRVEGTREGTPIAGRGYVEMTGY